MLRALGRSPILRAGRRLLSTSAEPYDVVVIGGGPGGYPAAIKAGQLGLRVACIESRGRLGGTCLNVGCIPSKALLHSSHLYEEAAHGWGPHGISADNVKMDLGKLMEHKAKTVTGLTGGIEGLLKKYKVDYFKGKGEILKAGSVKVTPIEGGEVATLDTKNIVIASGSVPASLPGVPVDETAITTSTGALDLKEIPKKMIVIGAGVIGLEMGSVWRRLGTEVRVLSPHVRATRSPHATPAPHPRLTRALTRTLGRALTASRPSPLALTPRPHPSPLTLALTPHPRPHPRPHPSPSPSPGHGRGVPRPHHARHRLRDRDHLPAGALATLALTLRVL